LRASSRRHGLEPTSSRIRGELSFSRTDRWCKIGR